ILVEFGNPLVSSFSFMTYSRSCRGSIRADGLAAQRLALDLELMQDVARRKSARLLQQRSAAGEIHRSQILASGQNDPCRSPPSEVRGSEIIPRQPHCCVRRFTRPDPSRSPPPGISRARVPAPFQRSSRPRRDVTAAPIQNILGVAQGPAGRFVIPWMAANQPWPSLAQSGGRTPPCPA